MAYGTKKVKTPKKKKTIKGGKKIGL